ncbi:MAG TPA: PilC/PilY family type IV pilus protein [Candidatus Competibacteraceae bacterium]|nr:PilC/PilY family type IV pilus protein [Candidatus Competibacteraceae bacterium]
MDMNGITIKAKRMTWVVLACTSTVLSAQARAAVSDSISQSPLFMTTSSVDPNIMFILDDSGSMGWDYMPDEVGYDPDHPDYVPANSKRRRSSTINKIYYNPNIIYEPPVDENGNSLGNATYSKAWTDGYDIANRDGSTVNLKTRYYAVYDPAGTGCSPVNIKEESCYRDVKVTATSPEAQNFANWYSYYRTRQYAARAGIGRAFAQQGDKIRVGYGRINRGSVTADGFSSNTVERGVRPFAGADRKKFFDWLYSAPANSGTPLRRALDDAGRYYESSARPWKSDPASNSGELLVCRSSYTILMTDGYWNSNASSTSASRANVDGTAGPTITGPGGRSFTYSPVSPFKDSWGHPNPSGGTLADVAMYYWKRDLRTDISNEVPTTPLDPAFWQHMVTFTVGLGVQGSIKPEDAFAAIASGANINWPEPDTSLTQADPARIDDLLHAAVNGRGGFFSATDPKEFADALAGILREINNRQSAATAVATNSTRVQEDTLAFQARFESEYWSGDLIAATLKPDGTQEQEHWRASSKLPAAATRKIFTFDEDTGKVVAFGSATLSNTMKGKLVSPSDPDFSDKVERMIKYLRGDASEEQRNGGSFRNRKNGLGDIVNSEPAVAGKRSYNWFGLDASDGGGYSGSGSYGEYLDNVKANRKYMVYVGANDGMLHAFDGTKDEADSGKEIFAYIPRAVFANLPELTKPTYIHRYFVDGSPIIGDAYDGAWKTVLVGTTGAGGKGIFALDISDPDGLAPKSVLWDISDASGAAFKDDLGYTIGQAQIDRLPNGKWVAIFGNGYNSNNKRAVLYIVDLFTGALIKKIDTGAGSAADPNGLSTPFVVPDPSGKYAKYVYAGDLHGNLWKFDLSGSEGSWDVAFTSGSSKVPLFKAEDASGNRQPITSQPNVTYHPADGYLVFFGTGKFFSPGDQAVASTPLVDSFYGLRDQGQVINGRNRLQEQVLSSYVSVTADGKTRELRKLSKNSFSWKDKDGWFIDLKVGNAKKGERVLKAPVVTLGRVFFTTYEPSEDPCKPGGISRLLEVNALDGQPSLALPDKYKDGSTPACPAGGACAGIELAAGAPLSPPVATTERLDAQGKPTGDQTLSILLPDGERIDALEVARIRVGRLRWWQLR